MDVAKLLEAISTIAWPLMAVFALWKLFPIIRDVAHSRGFTIKVGGMELSVQEASEKVRVQIEDLQKKLSEIRVQSKSAAAPAYLAAEPSATPPPRRILWVDDKPANNAFEIARLHEEDIDVIQATTNADALKVLTAGRTPVGAVVSDMVRRKAVVYKRRAGLDLIREARSAGVSVPIFVYSTTQDAERYRDDVLSAGGNGATASPVELFEMIREALASP